MKASNLIAELNRIMEEVGDIEVGAIDYEYGRFNAASGAKIKIQHRDFNRIFSDDEKLGEFFIGIE